jgi:hypothetical protein
MGRVRYIAAISAPCSPFTAWPAARRLESLETSASTWSGVCSTAALAIGIPLPRHPGSLATPSQQMLTRQTRHLGLSLVSMTLSSHVGLLLRPGALDGRSASAGRSRATSPARTRRSRTRAWSAYVSPPPGRAGYCAWLRVALVVVASPWSWSRRPGRGRVAERSLGPSSSARISPPSRRCARETLS